MPDIRYYMIDVAATSANLNLISMTLHCEGLIEQATFDLLQEQVETLKDAATGLDEWMDSVMVPAVPDEDEDFDTE